MARNNVTSYEGFTDVIGSDEENGGESVSLRLNLSSCVYGSKKNATNSLTFFAYPKVICMDSVPIFPTDPPRGSHATTKAMPSFCAPNLSCLNVAVAHNMTFVLSKVVPLNPPATFSVLLHVYDLSKGFVDRHSEKLTGLHVSGLYHSGVVCYGMEFFFGGGIAVTAAGQTRFGKDYKEVFIGTTTKTLGEFMAWVHQREKDTYQIYAYHPTKHNCHHFSSDALTFLLGKNDVLPSFILTTTNGLLQTKLGAGVEEVFVRIIPGLQYVFNYTLRKNIIVQWRSAIAVKQCAEACDLNSQPPVCVVLFRVDDAQKCRQFLKALLPYVEKLMQRGLFDHRAIVTLNSSLILCDGVESIDPNVVLDYVKIVASVLMHTHTTLWGPVLNGLRIAVLHKVVLCACVFHPFLLGTIANGVRDFLGMTADGKLALLRFLCNMSSGVHGAMALNSDRFALMWVSAVGLALTDYRNSAVVYTGAALAVNLAIAFVLTATPPVSGEGFLPSSNFRINKLMTVLLYYLCYWPDERIPEAAMNMMLLALFFLMSSSPDNMRITENHEIKLNYSSLLKRSQSNESKALICLIHGLDRICYMFS